MKKLFLFLVCLFCILFINAQTIECNGTYIVNDPENIVTTRYCDVSVYDNSVKLLIFDIPVNIKICEKTELESNSISGVFYYLDNECESWIFYGNIADEILCIISIAEINGRYIFTRKIC